MSEKFDMVQTGLEEPPIKDGLVSGDEGEEPTKKKKSKKNKKYSKKVPPPETAVIRPRFQPNNGMYGTSKYMGPYEDPQLVAEAELHDFAPTPCICCIWAVNDKVRKRTYFRVYENRLEYNWPVAPCCCLTKERCILDNTSIMFFDKRPSRSGMCCICIPATCCGPPVLALAKPF